MADGRLKKIIVYKIKDNRTIHVTRIISREVFPDEKSGYTIELETQDIIESIQVTDMKINEKATNVKLVNKEQKKVDDPRDGRIVIEMKFYNENIKKDTKFKWRVVYEYNIVNYPLNEMREVYALIVNEPNGDNGEVELKIIIKEPDPKIFYKIDKKNQAVTKEQDSQPLGKREIYSFHQLIRRCFFTYGMSFGPVFCINEARNQIFIHMVLPKNGRVGPHVILFWPKVTRLTYVKLFVVNISFVVLGIIIEGIT